MYREVDIRRVDVLFEAPSSKLKNRIAVILLLRALESRKDVNVTSVGHECTGC